ncbi:hypothetical protein [Sphingobium boeckii]|uniref:Uncharacterized protein n=1 Tax=Sphingobium boeckii TaxID=1082345 RepID=A0A7W9EE40_9SPHN|nr:hypothetical protein [Sphingobium boeckii]MBB5684291.1 hypothetical protein [Sphingobium boeckii]
MTVQIGDKTYRVRKPKDLDAELLATTGCSAAEMEKILAGSPLAHLVARAILPFIDAKEGEPVVSQGLAEEIAAAGVTAVSIEARKLYAPAAEAAAKIEPADAGGKDA